MALLAEGALAALVGFQVFFVAGAAGHALLGRVPGTVLQVAQGVESLVSEELGVLQLTQQFQLLFFQLNQVLFPAANLELFGFDPELVVAAAEGAAV